jgi:Domain of unknown function (DUF1995)
MSAFAPSSFPIGDGGPIRALTCPPRMQRLEARYHAAVQCTRFRATACASSPGANVGETVGFTGPCEGVADGDVGMPQLYDAWFPPDHELAVQMRAAVTAAIGDGIFKMELKWPCVPNLEEVAFGTRANMMFGKQVVAPALGMDTKEDYPLVKRYLTQFSDLYWVSQVAKAFPDRTVWAYTTDNVSKTRAEGSLTNVRLCNPRSIKSGERPKDGDCVVIVDPRGDEDWKTGVKLQPSPNSPLIFLNSQFSETYGLLGPRSGELAGTEAVYFIRRVTRGYVFRSYPQAWQAVLERPDMSCEVVASFDRLPSLREVASIVRVTSNDRYGAFNDRYAKGFGGRL